MMNLAELIIIKYPTLRNLYDFQVGDHGLGNGQEIVSWTNTFPMPSATDITAWMADPTVQQQYTFAQNKLTNQAIYAQLDAIDVKSVRPLRANDSALLATLEQQAATLRTQLLPTS